MYYKERDLSIYNSLIFQNTPLNDGLPLRFAAGISTAVAAVCIAQPTEVTYTV